MNAWTVLATGALAAIVITLWIAAICRPAKPQPAKPQPAQPYTPPPITDAYVDREFAVLEWHLTHTGDTK